MPDVFAPDGCRLHVDDVGSGEAVVLIPGLGGSARFWTAMTPALALRYRVISFDQRGAGRSDRPAAGPYTIEAMAGDLTAVLDHLGVGRAHLVGHSTGGVIALVMALDRPERVGKLVLSASWDRPDHRFRAMFETRLAILERAGPETYARLTQLIGYPPEWIEANPQRLAEAARAADDLLPIEVTAARIRMLLAFDRSDELARIATPVLVIGAPDDMVVAFARSEALAARIPGARLLMRRGGHFYPQLDPPAFAADVAAFLGGGGTADGSPPRSRA